MLALQIAQNSGCFWQGGPCWGCGLWREAHRGGQRGRAVPRPRRARGRGRSQHAVAAGRGDSAEVQHEPGQLRGQRQQGEEWDPRSGTPRRENILPQQGIWGSQVTVSFYADGGKPINQTGVFLTGVGESGVHPWSRGRDGDSKARFAGSEALAAKPLAVPGDEAALSPQESPWMWMRIGMGWWKRTAPTRYSSPQPPHGKSTGSVDPELADPQGCFRQAGPGDQKDMGPSCWSAVTRSSPSFRPPTATASRCSTGKVTAPQMPCPQNPHHPLSVTFPERHPAQHAAQHPATPHQLLSKLPTWEFLWN